MSDTESVVGNEESKMSQPLQSRELRARRLTEFYSRKNALKGKIESENFYQVHAATRNAQTVTWKGRHLPVFQLFIDMIVSLGMITTCVTIAVTKLSSL